MILQSLYELYSRLAADPAYEIAPPGFSLQKIVFRIVLKPDGSLHAIEDARVKDKRGRPGPRQLLVPGQSKSSGSGLNPCFLWDTTDYLLGYQTKKDAQNKGDKSERAGKAFQASRGKHLRLENEIPSPAYRAVCRFLEKWNPLMAKDWPVLDEVGNGYGVFQLIGETGFVHEDPEVKKWWLVHATSNGEVEGQAEGQCLVTGKKSKLARLHFKIKKVGQGDAQLVSFNDEAYVSYGKEQSFNAPTSTEAAFQYATALNALLDGPMREKHSFSFGDAKLVFWTQKPTVTEDVFAQFIKGYDGASAREPVQDESVRKKLELFVQALKRGREAGIELEGESAETPFFMLGLTSQARGRIGVRLFHRHTVGELLENLRRHYSDMAIVRRFDESKKHPDPEIPALWQILDETAPRHQGKVDRDAIPPILEGPLLRAVIAGTSYPAAMFSAVMRRLHNDRDVNYVRACIIAGYLRRNLKREVSMSLDKSRKDVAYRLGRLFAALEKTQRDALGKNLETTIRERFYSAASATPGVVFPRLLRTYQHHLAKLEGGLKVVRERLVQEIMETLDALPSHLGLADQGLFAIGYYHQIKDLWTSKEEKESEKGE